MTSGEGYAEFLLFRLPHPQRVLRTGLGLRCGGSCDYDRVMRLALYARDARAIAELRGDLRVSRPLSDVGAAARPLVVEYGV